MMHGSFDLAEKIMIDYAHRTGVLGDRKPRRYLWTDSFAVCNYLGLYRISGNERYMQLALKLVDQVHFILGRHREDDPRRGWISGLNEEEGKRHPTLGGLRIGKRLPEREPDEPFDESLEWERDGQYYHYLTRWMHALNRVSRETRDPIYNLWAAELAKTAHAAFVYERDGQRRIYWKMSIDLTRPLVDSMGLHDPLDGFVVYNEIQASAPRNPEWPSLTREINELLEICMEMNWATDDPLGIGGLLWNSYFLAEMLVNGRFRRADLLLNVLNDSLLSLELYLATDPLRLSASNRLAFRELGLSIGFKAVKKLQQLVKESNLSSHEEICSLIRSLTRYSWIGDEIEKFWLRPESRKSSLWKEHQDINMVMLATSLIPDGFL